MGAAASAGLINGHTIRESLVSQNRCTGTQSSTSEGPTASEPVQGSLRFLEYRSVHVYVEDGTSYVEETQTSELPPMQCSDTRPLKSSVPELTFLFSIDKLIVSIFGCIRTLLGRGRVGPLYEILPIELLK